MLSPRTGRILSAAGAVLLAVALFVTWYTIDRGTGAGSTEASGWDMFFRLRVLVLAGAVFVLASAVVRQTRPVLIARTIVGLVVAALIVRRIIDPPSLGLGVTPQIGVFLGALGALLAAAGGLIDSGRVVVDQRPDLAFWRGSAGELPRASDEPGGGRAARADVVDSTAKEL